METHQTLDLTTITGVVLDMDGVVWAGAETLPGTPDFFLFLQQRNIPYALATNNSSKNIAEYVARLNSLGVPVTADNIITSGTVTAEAMTRQYPVGTPIYVIGSESLIQLLTSHGYVFDPEQAKVVVVGLDITLTYEKLRIAGQRILAGADFIGTNGDVNIPTATGLAPGNGSIIAALQSMTGHAPRLMGKPEPIMFQIALERLKTPAKSTLMIGDRLDTDIDGAKRAGLQTAMVLTGVSTRAEVGEITPDGIYDDLAGILRQWQNTIR